MTMDLMVVTCRLHLLLNGDSNDKGDGADAQAWEHATDVGLHAQRVQHHHVSFLLHMSAM